MAVVVVVQVVEGKKLWPATCHRENQIVLVITAATATAAIVVIPAVLVMVEG